MWSTGATTKAITVSPSVNTSYTVTVTYSGGCTSLKSATVTVSNCGTTYCTANGTNKTNGYINKVVFRTICNTSGWNGGYGNFLNQSTTVTKGTCYNISVSPGYQSSCSQSCVYTRVWIDWNHDGDFTDAGELVFAPSTASTSVRTGCICIPSTALSGSTRMRVAIKHGSAPACCGTFTYGEVEDYTIVISGGNTREIMEETATEETMPIVSFKLYPNPVSDQLVVEQIDENNMPVENIATDIQLIDENGRVAFKTVFTDAKEVIEVSNYISGIYIVQMRTKSTFSTQKIIISH